MGFFKDFFKRKEITPGVLDTRTGDQQGVDSSVAQFILKNIGKFEPGKEFDRDLSIGASDQEKTGLEFLDKFLGGPDRTDLSRNATDVLNKTLEGDFDPRTSPFYQSFREGAAINREDAIDRVNREFASTGEFFAKERIGAIGDETRRAENSVNQLLGKLFETERGRQFQATQLAPALETFNLEAPKRKAEAALDLGSLPRELETADLERFYTDFLRKQEEEGNVVKLGANFNTQAGQAFEKRSEPSSAEKVLKAALAFI